MARGDAVCRLMMTVPGVGPVIALEVLAGIDDRSRFRHPPDRRQFGLTLRRDASGEIDRTERISKCSEG